MSRKIMLLVFVLILLLTAGLTDAQDEPIRIGILTDQSGWLSVYGVEQQNGFELGLLYAAGVDPLEYDSLEDALAAVEVAGRPVEIIVYDYGSADAAADADNAAAGARELIESNFVDIIFGTPNSGAAIQVQQITSPDEFNLLFMAGPSASPSITGANFNPNTFRVCRNTNHDAAALTTVADQFGQTYIQIAVDTDFGRATAAAFQASLSAKGIEPVGDVLLVPTDVTDFTPFIQQIIDSGADFVNPILAGGPITLWTQQSEELGLTDAVLTLTGTNSNDFIVAAPPAPGSVAYIVYQYT
ncbi:MAG: ABC transporter substrate-binding protein, partial [Anaerolineae bacterium]|nr:ABC transporter substrate-binding protein [Anaerolineae bacterium]